LETLIRNDAERSERERAERLLREGRLVDEPGKEDFGLNDAPPPRSTSSQVITGSTISGKVTSKHTHRKT
jgi:hypothetical protein